ncbi:MAG: hypothetical protein MUF36_01550 [Bacteroidales bacterium]|nr:hypothetical protein [Bacteroidales bacterium]
MLIKVYKHIWAVLLFLPLSVHSQTISNRGLDRSNGLSIIKLIKPDISIFRVCDVGEDIIHREIAIAFFNGYGTELHMGRPGGRNENFISDREFLARTTFILRQNSDAFLDHDWTPMFETTSDNIFVNRWNSGTKTIYTVLNMMTDA